MASPRDHHPLDHQPSFRAVIEAGPPVAELASRIAEPELVGSLAVACSELVTGFAAAPDTARRREAHQRAWVAVRRIDRVVTTAGRDRLAPARLVRRAQRAIDRADVLIGALLPS